MEYLVLDTMREGYEVDQVPETMTVGELISFLSQFDDDLPVYTGHDNRYTYGGITESQFSNEYFEEDDEDYE